MDQLTPSMNPGFASTQTPLLFPPNNSFFTAFSFAAQVDSILPGFLLYHSHLACYTLQCRREPTRPYVPLSPKMTLNAGSEANLINNGIDSLYAPPIDLSGNQANIHKGYSDQTEPTGGYFQDEWLDETNFSDSQRLDKPSQKKTRLSIYSISN